MKIKLTPIQILGLFLLLIAMVIYHLVPETREGLEGPYLLNYALSILYFLLSFADRPKGISIFKLKRPRLNWHILLSLLFVSCFTFNKNMHVFALTPLWVELAIVVTLISFLLVSIKGLIPEWLIKISSFIFGMCILIFIYYTIVLLPLLPVGFMGLILLGISIHLLVPMMLVVVSVACVLNGKCKNVHSLHVLVGFLTGVVCVMIYVGIFTYHSNQIKDAQKELLLSDENTLPEWVSYAKKCSSEYWAKRILARDLLYEEYSDDWWDFDFNRGSFSEIYQHDPLVAIASLFNNSLPLSNLEQVKILLASSNTRHYAYEKLWSGKNLHINKEVTDVRIYPDYRMAYFEKSFWITNENKNVRSQQEALFTFYLPDGAVASSLSLWIDGKEEKSRLTTRKKATKAYTTIVGKERRDPVVLHWQEGNRLTATIFPCAPKEARRVKIGVTVPLIKINDRLSFTNMKVLGPDNSSADEIIHLKIMGDSEGVDMPRFLKEELPNQFIYSGSAVADWSCSFAVTPLSNKPFSFNQKSWCLQPLKYTDSVMPKVIYLDVNMTWRKSEVMEIMVQAGEIPVYVFAGEMIELKPSNVDNIFGRLSKRAFSLFPVFEIKNPDSSLLISKGQSNSPLPSDLKNSVFHEQLLNYMSKVKVPVATLIIDRRKSPFITALEQYKIIECNHITADQLKTTQVKSWFKRSVQPQGGVNLPMSQISIVPVSMNDDSIAQLEQAPSHLLRLFNYHTLMQEAGHLFLQKDADIPNSIYSLCNEAFIVSPVSSLIVLETQKDYDRFGIKENKNSLKNANLRDSGAVPEPGEWALMIIMGLIISGIYIKFR